MNNNYSKTENQIYSLVRQYGEFAVKTALSYLMRVGSETLTEEYAEKAKREVIEKHNEAKEAKKNLLVSAKIECNIIDVAFELAKFDIIHIFAFMQANFFFDVGKTKISNIRMNVLLHNTLSVLKDKFDSDIEFIETLIEECDFGDSEIEELGYGEQLVEYFNDED